MKKMVLFAAIIVSIMLVGACKSAPPETTEDSFKRVYDRYYADLILDGAREYTVKGGDTLSAIARTHYNSGLYYPLIMLASKDIVLDPDKIEPGMVLTIPDLQVNLANDKAKASIKSVLLDCANIEDSRDRATTAQGLRDQANGL